MRRPLTRATAACATYALALSLWAVAPAAALDVEVPAVPDGTALSEGRAAPTQPTAEPGRTAPADAAPGDVPLSKGLGPVAADADVPGPTDTADTADGAGDTAPADEDGRTEVRIASWTEVDRAFPDRPGDAEAHSVGTGRLAWDRVYVRRALFGFPVAALAPGAVVDSAVLRVEVAWSYDCDGDSFAQLHRIDPFDAGTTWNDQPTARALLDTRGVSGGQAACPVSGGVEFDVTEAYQWAVDNGESHLHLRLGERDESGTTAWRRFDVRDAPPTIVVEHSTPPAPDAASDSPVPGADRPTVLAADGASDLPTGSPDDSRPSTGRAAVHEVDAAEAPNPPPATPNPSPARSAQGSALSGDPVAVAGGADDIRVRSLDPGGRLPVGGERDRSQRGERIGRTTAPGSHRDRDGDAAAQARGPPPGAPPGDRTRFTDGADG